MARHGSKDKRHMRREFNELRWSEHHFYRGRYYFNPQSRWDDEEERYWLECKRREEEERKRKEAEGPKGLSRKQTMDYLKDMFPDLINSPEDILNQLERLNILEPIDFYSDETLPEEATDIFTTDIPTVVDYAMVISKIMKWIEGDIKKIWAGMKEGKPGDKTRAEAIDWALFVASTYRKGLRALRRKIKAEFEERELQKEVELYSASGLDIEIPDFFEDEPRLSTALESAGIRYLFQLLSLSRTQVAGIEGIGKTFMEKIDATLEKNNLSFWGKEPEKKKKTKKKEIQSPAVILDFSGSQDEVYDE